MAKNPSMPDKPARFAAFEQKYKDVFEAYEKMGTAAHQAGPIQKKTRELIKLGISAGAQKEGAVHSHTRKALESGATKEEIRQVVLLTLPTLGMPSMMAAMTWIEDILSES